MRWYLGGAMLGLMLSIAGTAVAESGRPFNLNIVLPGLSPAEAEDAIVVLSGDKRAENTPDFSGVTFTEENGSTRVKGTAFVSGANEPVYLGFDLNRNGKIDDQELRQAPSRPQDVGAAAIPAKTAADFNHTAVVFIEAACACAGKPYACSVRTVYKVALVLKATGEKLWGDEDHEAIMDNTCSFTQALGKDMPIPQEVLDRPPSDLNVKLVADGVEQVVPFYGALTGTGPRGPQGAKGDKGDQGDKGDRGDVGPHGSVGVMGPAGPKGDVGAPGPAGPQGDRGVAGPAGPKGDQGPVGPQGVKGDIGPQGIPGPKGDAGPNGPAGPIGVAGPAGPKGDVGDPGPAGPQGPKGDTGLVGPAGPKGDNGAPGEKGGKGDTGPAGPMGPPGSQDVRINGVGPRITFQTPTYQGATFNDVWLLDSFAKKADLVHAHDFTTDIKGHVPTCGAGVETPVCREDGMLKSEGVYYLPATMYNGQPIRQTLVPGLFLGAKVGDWNDIGIFDQTAIDIVSVSGTAQATDGVYLVLNSDGSLRVRIADGKIQEWHGDSVLNGRPVILRVDFVKKTTDGQ